ncbi:MAG: putative metal-dependent hydrolase [Gemmatimonadota bacterium]
MTDDLERLRYPVGKFAPRALDASAERSLIDALAAQPAAVASAVTGLDEQQLDTPYRPGGWTVRQVVHHLPDSHLNAYVRMKKAVTEDTPLISTYEEARWAELPDSQLPIDVSLRLLAVLHERWIAFLRGLAPEQLSRTFRHPEWNEISVRVTLQLYEWHGRHHIAHITALREREGW